MGFSSKSRSSNDRAIDELPPGMVYFKSVGRGHREKTYWIPYENVQSTFDQLVKFSDRLTSNVELYDEPLPFWNKVLVVNKLASHSFVVFETKSYYWSVEKDERCVTLQRSTRKESVLHHCHCTERLQPVKMVKKRHADQVSVGDFIRFLVDEPLVITAYSLLGANCKKFSASVFNYLTVAQ